MSIINNSIIAGASGQAGGAGEAITIQRSLRFTSSDSAYLSKTFASAGNRKTWTWAGWVKRSKLGITAAMFASRPTSSPLAIFYFSDLDYIRFDTNSNTFGTFQTNAVFRDPSAWYHVVLAADSTQATNTDRLKLYVNGIQQTFSSVTYPAQNADGQINTATLHGIGAVNPSTYTDYFDGCLADVHFLDGITPGTDTDDANGSVTGIPNAEYLTDFGEFDDNGVWQPIEYTFGTNPNNGTTWSSYGDANADPSFPWTNAFNGNVATTNYVSGTSTTSTWTPPTAITVNSSLRILTATGTTSGLYVNGSLVSSSGSYGNAAWTTISGVSSLSSVGTYNSGTQWTIIYAIEVDGYVLLDGAVDNSFHLPFSDNSGTSSTTLGKDAAGSNNWTPNNFSVASGSGNDSLVDVPRNGDETDTGVGNEVRGNYCTWNPLNKGANMVLLNGNLDIATTTGRSAVTGTIGVSSGKWYWETTITGANDRTAIGIAKAGMDLTDIPGDVDALGWSYFADGGNKYHNATSTAYGASFANGDTVAVALDLDAGTIAFYKNGVSQGTAFTGLSGEFFPAAGDGSGVNNANSSTNFGARPFLYSAPSGFKALCTASLPTPTIENGSAYMDVKLYTGNGSTQTISGLEFSPDLIWVKNRTQGVDHVLFDAIRGFGANEELVSNEAWKEGSTGAGFANTDVWGYVESATSDGFVVNKGSNASGSVANTLNNAYVAWTWDGGSSTVSNTDGSITSQVRAQPSAGCSVVTYTGTGSAATVGHGLNAAPGMVIYKSRGDGNDWIVYHQSLGNTKFLILNSTGGQITSSTVFNNTSPTSSVINLGSSAATNNSTSPGMVAYCFAPVAGYSAMGSYTGNGSSDGPFVYTGMRPQWIMVKCSSSDQSGNAWWLLYDGKRIGYNSDNKHLGAQASDIEYTANSIDILSNGFKIRDTNTSRNANGATYVYACFAENPFSIARAR